MISKVRGGIDECEFFRRCYSAIISQGKGVAVFQSLESFEEASEGRKFMCA